MGNKVDLVHHDAEDDYAIVIGGIENRKCLYIDLNDQKIKFFGMLVESENLLNDTNRSSIKINNILYVFGKLKYFHNYYQKHDMIIGKNFE